MKQEDINTQELTLEKAALPIFDSRDYLIGWECPDCRSENFKQDEDPLADMPSRCGNCGRVF